MKEDARIGGLAMMAGSVGVLVTLVLHPSERGLFDPAQVESVARTMVIVHSVALVSLPLWFFGAFALSRRIDHWLGVGGLIVYGFALGAMMNALVIDGLVTPGLARAIANATADKATGWKIAFNHNAFLDQAFMSVFVVASSVAIALWSAAIVRSVALARVLGIFGCVLGTATVIAQLTGLLGKNPHIFFLVVIGQAIWFFSVGLQLFLRFNDANEKVISRDPG
jgi:hypothetical protein